MKHFKLAVCGIISALALTFAVTLPTFAVSCPAGSLRASANSLAECNVPESSGGSAQADFSQSVGTIVKFIVGIAGVIAVVIIIIAGINIAVSQGDSAKLAKATKAIIFAAVGLVVCLLAFAIVNFALDGIGGAGAAGGDPSTEASSSGSTTGGASGTGSSEGAGS